MDLEGKKAFTISVSGGNGGHVATVLASTTEELEEKILQACEEHFGCVVRLITNIEFEQTISRPQDVSIQGEEGGDVEIEMLEVQQTWIY